MHPLLWLLFPVGTFLAAAVLEGWLLVRLARDALPRRLLLVAFTYRLVELAFPSERWPFGFDRDASARRLAFVGATFPVEGFIRVKHLSLYLGLLLGGSLFALVLGREELTQLFGVLFNGDELNPSMPPFDFARGLLLATAGPFLAIGWFAPDFWLRRTSAGRRRDILEQMPDFLELMAACMNAGAEYERALEIIARTMGGPLARELRLTIAERELAVPRSKYMQLFASRTTMRTGVVSRLDGSGTNGPVRAAAMDPETWIVDEFARTVDQATDLGTSLQATLRDQASRMRQYRFAKAQELARASSVGVALPLGLMVLGMLITILVSLFYSGRQALPGLSGGL